MKRQTECVHEPCVLRGTFKSASRAQREYADSGTNPTTTSFEIDMIRTLFFVASLPLLLSFSTVAVAQQPLPASGDETALLDVLKSDAELFEKAKACQRLAVIGTSKAVPVLADLLGDEQLSHYARTGLEANPSPDVDEAFRNSVAELSGKQLVGVINSIGVRRDVNAIPALAELVDRDSDDVAQAAIAALGQMATPEAAAVVQQALGGRESLRVAAADACLSTADASLSNGKTKLASSVLAAVRAAELPKHIDVASRFAQIRTGSADTADLLKEYLAADDYELFRIGLSLADRSRGNQATRLILDQLETLPTDRQTLLIHVLGSRSDRAALPAVLAAAKSDKAALRAAGIEVLGTLGDVSVLPVLLKAAASEEEELAAAAQDSLSELEDERVDAAVLDALPDSNGPRQIVLIKTIGRRGIAEAIGQLLTLMSSGDAELSGAAIDALGMTVGAEELPALVDQLLLAKTAETAAPLKDALSKACTRMADRDAAAGMLFDRMKNASADAKGELLDLMIYVGGEQALTGIGNAAKGDDDALADSATQALGKWLTPDVAPVLLDLAVNGNDQFRIRCLRGYIRVIRQFGLKGNARLQMSKTAFKAATRDEERKLVLDTVTRFPSVAGLRFVTPHLSDAALQEDAAKAAITIGEKIVEKDRKAVATVIPKLLAATEDQDLVNRANVLAERAGR